MRQNFDHKSDRQVLITFRENLRLLASREKSITALCRELRVNRSQFNRYLSGETMPRPLVLYRICQHFNVDARILFEPLEDLTLSMTNPLVRSVGAALDMVGNPVSRSLLPDGTYASWRASIQTPGHIVRNLVSIQTKEGMRQLRTRVRHSKLGIGGVDTLHKDYLHFRGLALRQLDGFATFEQVEGSPLIFISVYRTSFDTNDRIFPGISMIGRSINTSMPLAAAPVFLEMLEPGYRSIRAATRRPYRMPTSEAPPTVIKVLSQIAENSFLMPDLPPVDHAPSF